MTAYNFASNYFAFVGINIVNSTLHLGSTLILSSRLCKGPSKSSSFQNKILYTYLFLPYVLRGQPLPFSVIL